MKLYIYEHCPFCSRARMIMGLKNVEFDTEVIMEGDADTPVRLVGKKVVPILQKPDGSHMTESMDIVRYVDNEVGSPMLTAPAIEAVEAWCKQAWPVAIKLIIPRFTQGTFKETSTPQARQAYLERERKAFGDLDALMQDTPVLVAQVNVLLEELEAIVPVDDQVNISDFALFPVLRSLSIVRDAVFGPNVARYMHSLSARSGVPLLADQAR